MAKSDDFVHLHLHSDYSQLDGLGKVSEYVELAAKRGSPAIAFTDHGTMRGYLQQHTQCEKHNVKPIYGTEFYVSPDMRRRGLSDDEKVFLTKDLPRKDHRKAIEKHEEQIGLRDRWHITVWAYNQQGLQNLYRLSSAAWIEGFYYKARIDLPALIEHGEGLMVSTGCLASPIHEQWREGKKKAALEFADRLHDAFGDRLWLEIQPHNIKIQRLANLLCTKLRDRYPKSRLLATQDAHYVRQGDAPHHDCLLCIGTNAQIDDQERFRFDGDEFFFKSRRQMRESFEKAHPGLSDKQVTEALNSTLVFAERCSAVVEVDYKKALLPDPGIPEEYGGDAFKFLKTLCLDGWSWRNIKARAERYAMANSLDVPHAVAIYRDRLLAELKLIRSMKFERYFIMVFDIYREARKRKIFVGPGRGSVGGSLAAYLLGIHSVDPIQHGLLFERFINPDRKDLPDIDMDFEDSRRGEMIEYMRNKYGTENVCQISTIGKLSGKSCFKDVCRVTGVPYTLANALTASIIHRNPHEEREFNCIEDSFGQENLKAFDKKFPAVKLHGMAIEGTAKTLGIHAAGLIASPVPLRDITPLEVRNSGGEKTVVCALDMNDAAKIGLVKLDFLGLKTLTVIRKCLEAIKERHGKTYDLESEEFDIDDPKVLQAFTDHDYIGVFQYDSPSADQVCKGVTFDRFADVPTMTALNRPGTTDSGMDEQFRKRKANPKLLKKHDFHPIVSNIAKDTLGVLCYQEHLIEIFKQVGGMTPGEADSLRRAVGKKLAKEEIEKYREGFVKGAEKVGVSSDIAGRLMDAIVKFANYGFNKSHATEYGLIGYWCMWLKTYYPLEFFWALLWAESDTDKIKKYAVEAKRREIAVLPAHVNTSGAKFTINGEEIWGSLVDIKGVGDKAAEDIQAKAPFKSFVDFVVRIDRRRCNRGAVVALVRAGAFFGMVNVRWLIENMDDFWKQLAKAVGKKGDAQAAAIEVLEELVEAGKKESEYDQEELKLIQAEQNPLAFMNHPMDAYKSFIKREIKVSTTPMDGDFFEEFDSKGIYVSGIITGVRKHQVGDYGDREKDHPDFGKPYANVNIQDSTGTERRVKFAPHVYQENQAAIDAGAGKPLLIHCSPNLEFESIRGNFAVNLQALRMKLKAGQELSIWEQIVTGRHPASVREWSSEAVKLQHTENRGFFKGDITRFTGVVTHIQRHTDKKGRKMAYLGLLDARGHYVRAIAFADAWRSIRRVIKTGLLLRAPLSARREGKGVTAIFEHGKVTCYGARA